MDKEKEFRCTLSEAGIGGDVWVYVHVGNAATLFELGKRFSTYDGTARFWCNFDDEEYIACLRISYKSTMGTTVEAATALGELIARVEDIIGNA